MLQLYHNQIANHASDTDDIFAHIESAPVDAIFGISMAYKAD